MRPNLWIYQSSPQYRSARAVHPEVVLHQLTDLPDDAGEMPEFRVRNEEMRGEGTPNLAAAAAAQARRVIAQSISWEHPDEHARAVTAAHERAVREAGGVVIGYGQLYGPSSCASTAGRIRPGFGPAAPATSRCAASGTCPAART